MSAPQPLTGDELAAITQRAERARDFIAAVRVMEFDVPRLVAEVERLRAQVERVEALAGEWDDLDAGLVAHMVHWDYRTELRDALDHA